MSQGQMGIKGERRGKRSTEFRSCVKVEVDVLGSPSVIVIMVSVDVKQYLKTKQTKSNVCVQSSGVV